MPTYDMALPSETSDTREQFTWSHCYDMSLTVTAELLAMPVSLQRQCVNASHAQPDYWPWLGEQPMDSLP